MLNGIVIIAVLAAVGTLIIHQASIAIWAISYAFIAFLLMQYGGLGIVAHMLLWAGLLVFVLSAIKPLRRKFFSKYLFHIIKKAMPTMSITEREALEAGTVSWEGDLFSGAPDFEKLLHAPKVSLTVEEQAFLDGPVNQLCRMIDDWDITHNRTDLPPEVWQYLKDEGFLGMIIPKHYGGLEFSATAQVAVLVKVYGSSVSAASTIAVPNSLGPAELLLKYGTEKQKDYYLPRLAKGIEIPCFALTGPNAGSDAASIPDKGIVCQQEIDGEMVLGIRLNWDKRYITLSPVATLIGLAFRLFDPDNLLGKGTDVGISCALIPADTPGVTHGRRHYPLNIAFMNGPTQGKDVFIPIEYLIGGAAMAGNGWRMLMECLSAGRAISLPSSALGTTQLAAMGSGAYSRIRKQFHQSIANFEGIEDVLAQLAGNVYIVSSALAMTTAAIDNGAKSAIAGAILKYHTTELGRQSICHAMDIHGGKGICLGPNNYLGRDHQGIPIGITVEGANILTRSLIIFGQGAIRCHPYVFKEIESIRIHDLKAFDEAIWGHVSFILANFTQSFIYLFTDGRGSQAPSGFAKRYFQLINRYSSNLAFLADFCMITLGSKLKRKERISARLGDLLSALYLASGVLQRFYHDGEPKEDLPLVEWSCQQLFYQCDSAIEGVISNFPSRWGSLFLKLMLQPFGKNRLKPSDKIAHQLAKILTHTGDTRARLLKGVFCEPIENCPLGMVEEAFQRYSAVADLDNKVTAAVKKGQIKSLSPIEQIAEAESEGILSHEEAVKLKEVELIRQKVIAVDDFDNEELVRTTAEAKVNKNITSDDLSIEVA